VGKHTDLPVDERGFIVARPDLRIGTDAEPVADAWAAGDDAAIEDLTSPIPGTRTVPNAQHAVRQGELLACNIAANLRGGKLKNYRHHSFGAIAELGVGHGIFQYRRLVTKGPLAWLMHRGYHVLAVPSWERKVRVFLIWLTAGLFGRDILSLASVQHPRDAFIGGGEPAVLAEPGA
jgi:NADH dehydrogenase